MLSKCCLSTGVLALMVCFGCDSKTGPVAQEPSKPAAAVKEKPIGQPVVLRVDGKTTEFATFLVWDLMLNDNPIPQMAFYVNKTSCDDRMTSSPRFYAAFMAEGGVPEGKYQSPNWGYTGIEDFNPSSEDDEGYPPAYWGTVVVTKSTDASIVGTVDYASKGLSVKGAFEAQRCPVMDLH